MELVASLISFERIMALPPLFQLCGLGLVALLSLSAVFSVFRLRLIRAVTRIIMAVVILIILSQGGEALVQLLGGQIPANS
ncbi:MAG: hypothetical protein KDJ48_05620 [Nitratireductor sp.]|nr:hypothetical protein [Nitratireductor sp.]MCB1458728.1 hypothetical protein [Nitratireductor sp.]